jgi:hypothetical protein
MYSVKQWFLGLWSTAFRCRSNSRPEHKTTWMKSCRILRNVLYYCPTAWIRPICSGASVQRTSYHIQYRSTISACISAAEYYRRPKTIDLKIFCREKRRQLHKPTCFPRVKIKLLPVDVLDVVSWHRSRTRWLQRCSDWTGSMISGCPSSDWLVHASIHWAHNLGPCWMELGLLLSSRLTLFVTFSLEWLVLRKLGLSTQIICGSCEY